MLGILYERQGLLYEAFQEFSEALRINPEMAEARSRLKSVVS